MVDIAFKATVRDGGNAIVVTVPRAYIDNNLVELGKTYWFKLVEVEE